MKLKHMFLVAAGVMAFAAANVNAQVTITLGVGMAGSSAIWLESGQAAAAVAAGGCVYDSGSTKNFTLTDYRPNFQYGLTNTTDTGAGWFTWTPGGGTCAAPSGAITVNFYINTDSVVGQRCFFGVPRCYLTSATTVATPGKLISSNESTLPAAIITAINGTSGTITVGGVGKTVTGVAVNAAATDIRPEDGRFAAMRTLGTCGTAISGSQYLGLGYGTANAGVGQVINGSSIQTNGSGGSFNVLDFNIGLDQPDAILTTTNNAGDNANGTVGPFNVIGVGAQPIVVFVNPADENGFGSLQFTNINRGTLAAFLDGTLGTIRDAIPSTVALTSTAGSTVFLREPLSGTYNTMEYNIPNSVELQTSQDVGLAAKSAGTGGAGAQWPPYYCGANFTTTLSESYTDANGSVRKRARAIGTGNMVKAVVATSDSLGYAFWSAANFANTSSSPVSPATAKYVTVDGIDPLQETWVDGLVPQKGNVAFSNTSLLHVRDGSYPIWSVVRYVCDSSSGAFNSCTAVNNLFAQTQSFVSFGTDNSQPDFVPLTSMPVVRSHFNPPNVTYNCPTGSTTAGTPSNGDQGATPPECGGDVGGVVYNVQADEDYNANTLNTSGIIGRRQ